MILERQNLTKRYKKSDDDYKKRIEEFEQVAHRVLQLQIFPNAMLAGGSVLKMMINLPQIGDWDIFFNDKDAYDEYFEFVDGIKTKDTDVVETPYSATFYTRGEKIQLIKWKYFDTWEDLFDSFDMNVCMFGYDGVGNEVLFPEGFLKEAHNRDIRFHKIHAPTNTMMHLQRYIKYGFKAKRSEMRNLIMRAAATIDTDPEWDRNISQ